MKKKMKETAMSFAKETAINGAAGVATFSASRFAAKKLSEGSTNQYMETLISWGMFLVSSVGAYFVPHKATKAGIVSGAFLQGFMATGAYFAKKSQSTPMKNYFLGSESEILSGDTIVATKEEIQGAIEERAKQLAQAHLIAQNNREQLAGLIYGEEKKETPAPAMDGEFDLSGHKPMETQPEQELDGEFDLSGYDELEGEFDLSGSI